MIERRFDYAMKGSRVPKPDSWWAALFEASLSYRRTESFNYVIDRTTYRPRELIQFCTECIAVQGQNSRIDYETIALAERKYSHDRIDDITQEFRFQYPGLKPIFETFRGKLYTLSRGDIELHCIEILASAEIYQDAKSWLENQNEAYLIRALWEIGFIKALAVGRYKGLARSGSNYVGFHQLQNLPLDAVASFQVHPMFRSYLGMRESKGSATVDRASY